MPELASDRLPFVGRMEEVDLLCRLRDGAHGGQPSTVLITGEAGIGKTRLINTVLQGAVGKVLMGAAVPISGSAVAYGPWLQVTSQLPGGDGLISALPLSGSSSGRLETSRATLLDRWFRALARAALDSPVTVLLEDLHWADDATLELFAFVARRLVDERLFLVATARSGGGDTNIGQMMAELTRHQHIERIHLAPLPRSDLEAIVRAARPDRGASAGKSVLDRIFHDSGGNTFLAVELASADRPVPPRLRDIVLSRITHLGEEALMAIKAVAVLGRPVSHTLLVAILEAADVRRTGGDDLARVIESSVFEILNGQGGLPKYAFRHGLVEAVILDSLTPGEQLRWHRAIAMALSSRAFRSLAQPGEIAEHWFLADDADHALKYAVQAGQAATSLVAPVQAQRHFFRAVSLWDRVTDPEEVAGTTATELFRMAAAATRWAGDPEQAASLISRALEHANTDIARAELLERLGRYLYEAGDAGGALTAYQTADRLLANTPPSILGAQVSAALASTLMLSGRNRMAAIAAAAAADQAHGLGATAQEAYALTTAGTSEAALGNVDHGIELLDRARRLAEQSHDVEECLRAETGLVVTLDNLGRLDESLEAATRAYDITRKYQLDGLASAAIGNLMELQRLLGKWTEVDKLAASMSRHGPQQYESFVMLIQAQLMVARGQLDEAHIALDEAEPDVDTTQPSAIVPMWLTRADLALWTRAPEPAWSFIHRCLQLLPDIDETVLKAWTCAMAIRTIADARQDHAQRKEPSRLWEDRAEDSIRMLHLLNADPGNGPQAQAWLLTSQAERTRSEANPEPDVWVAAARSWQTLQRPYELAYCKWREAEAALSTGQRSRATSAATEGVQLAKSLGAEPLHAEILGLAKISRITTTPKTATVPRQTPWHLTAREVDVLSHLTAGASNRQIARALFISERTVAVHVSNLLAKMGAATRTEAAITAQRSGIREPK